MKLKAGVMVHADWQNNDVTKDESQEFQVTAATFLIYSDFDSKSFNSDFKWYTPSRCRRHSRNQDNNHRPPGGNGQALRMLQNGTQRRVPVHHEQSPWPEPRLDTLYGTTK